MSSSVGDDLAEQAAEPDPMTAGVVVEAKPSTSVFFSPTLLANIEVFSGETSIT
jgi:hypothetical protein